MLPLTCRAATPPRSLMVARFQPSSSRGAADTHRAASLLQPLLLLQQHGLFKDAAQEALDNAARELGELTVWLQQGSSAAGKRRRQAATQRDPVSGRRVCCCLCCAGLLRHALEDPQDFSAASVGRMMSKEYGAHERPHVDQHLWRLGSTAHQQHQQQQPSGPGFLRQPTSQSINPAAPPADAHRD